MFFKMRMYIVAFVFSAALCFSVAQNENDWKNPPQLYSGNASMDDVLAKLEDGAPKGTTDSEKRIAARKGAPEYQPEPLPSDIVPMENIPSDKEKLEEELHVTTTTMKTTTTVNSNTAASTNVDGKIEKHHPREGVDEKSAEIKNSSNNTKYEIVQLPGNSSNVGVSTKSNQDSELKNNNTLINNSTPSIANSSTSNSTITTSSTTTTNATTTTVAPNNSTIEKSNTKPKEDNKNNKNSVEDSENDKTSSNIQYEEPLAEFSQEPPVDKSHKDYIVPAVALIFAVPMILGIVIVSYRRMKDYWSTRHYRRMDFLVDGMYND